VDSISLLVEALDARWKKYRSNLEICRQEFSEAAVHDMRVSTRRLLALVDLLRALTPHPRLQKLRRAFKEQLDGYDDLRDTQVMLVEVSETLEELPELKPFEDFLLKREKRLLRTAAKQVKTYKFTGLARRLEAVRQGLLAQADVENVHRAMLEAVDDMYAIVLQRLKRVDASQSSSIHHLRVAFKKFRYALEIIQPLVPDLPAQNFKYMHAYQGAMGNIQDMEVLLLALADFARRDVSYNSEPIRLHFQQRHIQFIQAYLEDMQQIHTFWRQIPEAPYPWAVSASKKRSDKPKKSALNSKPGSEPEILPEGEQETGNSNHVESEKNESVSDAPCDS